MPLTVRLTEKTLIVTNLLVIVVSVMLAALFAFQTQRVIEGQFESRGKALARDLAYNAAYGLLTGNAEALNVLTKGVMDQPDVIFCIVKDESGREVAGRYLGNLSTVPLHRRHELVSPGTASSLTVRRIESRGLEYILVAAPVMTAAPSGLAEDLVIADDITAAGKTRLIGTAEVGMSLEGAGAIIRENSFAAFKLVLLLILVTSLVSILWVRHVLGPVRKLVEAMREFAGGNLDHRVEVRSRDEIGELADSFNTMAGDLKASTVSIGELKKSEKRFEDVAGSVGDWIWESDVDGRITYSSNVSAKVVGYDPAELKGKPLYNLIDSPSRAYGQQMITAMMTRGERLERQSFSFCRKDGAVIAVELTAIPVIEDGLCAGYRGMCRDVTARRRAEEALLENVRMRNNFTATVSHELRTPLTAIKEGIAIVLEGEAGPVNDEQKDLLATAKRNVDRLSRLITDVLDFTKMKSAKMRLRIRGEDINRIVHDAVEIHRVVAESRGLYMRTELAPSLASVKCDADKIVQVVNNFVGNALKFTEKGGITVTTAPSAGGVTVTVADTGPGIPQDDLAKLFTEFYQVKGAKQAVAGGTGLGLAISREIVELHGGRVWAESGTGAGARFCFFLPYEKKYTVLVIDDEENFRFFTGELLKSHGYAVVEAATGIDGMSLLHKFLPDIVIIDLKLPDINGYEVIGRIYSDKEMIRTSVVVVSGYSDQLAKLDPAIPRLVKPFPGQDLLRVIEGLLSREKTEP